MFQRTGSPRANVARPGGSRTGARCHLPRLPRAPRGSPERPGRPGEPPGWPASEGRSGAGRHPWGHLSTLGRTRGALGAHWARRGARHTTTYLIASATLRARVRESYLHPANVSNRTNYPDSSECERRRRVHTRPATVEGRQRYAEIRCRRQAGNPAWPDIRGAPDSLPRYRRRLGRSVLPESEIGVTRRSAVRSPNCVSARRGPHRRDDTQFPDHAPGPVPESDHSPIASGPVHSCWPAREDVTESLCESAGNTGSGLRSGQCGAIQ